MKGYVMALVVGVCASLTGVAGAADQLQQGKVVFDHWCAPCHAPAAPGQTYPGTNTLQAIYKGAKPAALEQRTDLTPALVAFFVRHGRNAMPWFRKTEISDTQLAALGAYLSRNSPHQ